MGALLTSMTIAALLAVTAPSSVSGVGPGSGAGGHVGGVDGGAVGHVAAVGSVGPDSPAGRLDHPDQVDGGDRFEHGGMLGLRDHVNERFDFPVCYAYPYCPSPLFPCGWQGACQ